MDVLDVLTTALRYSGRLSFSSVCFRSRASVASRENWLLRFIHFEPTMQLAQRSRPIISAAASTRS